MVETKSFIKFQEFLNHNRDEILGNYFIYYHLIQLIKTLNERRLDLFDAYNIVDDKGNEVICVWVTGNYFIYSNS